MKAQAEAGNAIVAAVTVVRFGSGSALFVAEAQCWWRSDREGRSSDTHGAELLTKWTFPPGTMTPATLGLFFYRTKP